MAKEFGATFEAEQAKMCQVCEKVTSDWPYPAIDSCGVCGEKAGCIPLQGGPPQPACVIMGAVAAAATSAAQQVARARRRAPLHCARHWSYMWWLTARAARPICHTIAVSVACVCNHA